MYVSPLPLSYLISFLGQNIVSRCDGKIIIIDTGISRAYGGRLSALRIDYSLTPNQKEDGGWVEEEKVVALYEDFEEVITVDTRVVQAAASKS
jgi:hypothetical protein